MQVTNQFPLFIHADAPRFERASYDDSLTAAFSYSSVYLVRESRDSSVQLDMEIAELELRLRKIVHGLFEVGVSIPILSFTSGFMDGFLDAYHSTFGLPDYGRNNRPDNEFLYELQRNGASLLNARDGSIGIGDIRLSLKRVMMSGDPVISLQADLELPTGSASRGFGNGSFDVGLSLLAEKRLSEKAVMYLAAGAAFPGDLKGKDSVQLREFLWGGLGIEAALWNRFSLLGQVVAQGSPFPDTGIPQVDRTSVLLSLGGRYAAGQDSFELSFTEDPNTAGAPDFTVSFSYRKRL